MGSTATPEVNTRFAHLMLDRHFQTSFQPIVRLATGAVVGYEALVRGPEGSGLTSADSLIAAAHRAGRLVEFDWIARASACRAALDADLDPDTLLFLNIEPIALDSECPPDLWPVIEQAFGRFRVVLEITERSLDRDPATLLDGIERMRPLTAGIAIDDCGSHPATLAMLPLMSPSVIKIDAGVVQAPPDGRFARVLAAVQDEVERTGAVVLAEGVETAEHRNRASAFGARFGQGLLYGGAAALPGGARQTEEAVMIQLAAPEVLASPFEAVRGRTIGHGTEALVGALMGNVGACADATAPVLYIVLLPGPEMLERGELDRLGRLAGQGTFAAVLGRGIPSEPGAGIRGTGSLRAPPPSDQWAAAVFGPCSSTAVMARRVPGAAGQWEYGVTHDRPRTLAAIRSLVRLLGSPEPRYVFAG